MGFEKTVHALMFAVTNQNGDVRLPIGSSASNTHTHKPNPMRGSLMWDKAMFVLHGVSVAGGATGGSYTITLLTDAVKGYTGLPIAQQTIGPNSAATIVMSNLHQSQAAPMPTHMYIDQTATGGGLWFNCYAVARQYRGALGNGSATAERIVQGTMVAVNTSSPYFSDSKGIVANTTLTVGTSVSDLGLNRMKLWDNALFWAIAGSTIDGAYDIDIIGDVGGTTVSIASTGTGSAFDTAGERLAIANNFYGQAVRPTHIIFSENSAGAGVSDPRIILLAKSGVVHSTAIRGTAHAWI